ncbi:MAG: TetR/AcrR family transcriptional regulator [Spirochaetales bacterium]|nr:TetR/AcrR family transcriptional regulator [Spirochaetales bacterium]
MDRKRNRHDAETRFISAVHELLLRRGFPAVGINAVAEQAGLNKVLIYRYFGGLDGLLAAYAERMDPFPAMVSRVETAIQARGLSDPNQVGAEILRAMIEGLRSSPELQEVLKWELMAQNPLSERIAEARERSGRRLQELFARYAPEGLEVDLEATTALLTGGVFYLYLRSATASVFNGIPINTAEGQDRLVRAAARIVAALLEEKITK